MRGKNQMDKEEDIKMMNENSTPGTAVSRVSIISAVNSDMDVVEDMNIDIVNIKNNATGPVKVTTVKMGENELQNDDDEGTDNELLYEGNDNDQYDTPKMEQYTPQTPGDNLSIGT